MGATMSSMIPSTSLMSTVVGQTLNTVGDKKTWEKVKRAEGAAIENALDAAELVDTAAPVLGSGDLESLAKDLEVPDRLAHDADSFGHCILTNDKVEENRGPANLDPIGSEVASLSENMATIARRAITSEEMATGVPQMAVSGVNFSKHAFEQQAAFHTEPTVAITAIRELGSVPEMFLLPVATTVDAAVVGVFFGSLLVASVLLAVRWTVVSRRTKKQQGNVQLRNATSETPAEKGDVHDKV